MKKSMKMAIGKFRIGREVIRVMNSLHLIQGGSVPYCNQMTEYASCLTNCGGGGGGGGGGNPTSGPTIDPPCTLVTF